VLNQLGAIELALTERVGEFHTGEDNSGRGKAFEAEHRPDPLLHSPVVLLNHVIDTTWKVNDLAELERPELVRLASTPPALHRRISLQQNTAYLLSFA
jgi:hypothetical protein